VQTNNQSCAGTKQTVRWQEVLKTVTRGCSCDQDICTISCNS